MDIKTVLIIVVLGIIIFVLNVILDRKKNQAREKKNSEVGKYFKAKSTFFSSSELIFFKLLEKENNGKYMILSKVRLEDIVSVVKGSPFGKRNHIKSRHLDFVLLDNNRITSAIELDGFSHNSKKQKYSDEIKNKVLEVAGIKLFRIKVGSDFEKEIKKIFNKIK